MSDERKTCGSCKHIRRIVGKKFGMCVRIDDADDDGFSEENSIAYTNAQYDYNASLMVSDAFGCNQWEAKSHE